MIWALRWRTLTGPAVATREVQARDTHATRRSAYSWNYFLWASPDQGLQAP